MSGKVGKYSARNAWVLSEVIERQSRDRCAWSA